MNDHGARLKHALSQEPSDHGDSAGEYFVPQRSPVQRHETTADTMCGSRTRATEVMAFHGT